MRYGPHYGLTNPKIRPRHGPLATSVWDDDLNRWRVEITEEGHREFHKVVAAFGGEPIKILCKRFGTLLNAANSHPDRAAMQHAALVGVLHAVRYYQPSKGTVINTIVMTHVANQVMQALRDGYTNPRPGQTPRPLTVHLRHHNDDSDNAPHNAWSEVSDHDAESPEDSASRREAAGRVRNLLGVLSGIDRRAVELRVLGGLDLATVGRKIGVTKERARQAVQRALKVMREAADGGKVVGKAKSSPSAGR